MTRPHDPHNAPPTLPAAYASFFDLDVPAFVKRTYSPRSAWRDRPFGPRDEIFFFRGVESLSGLFTTDRDGNRGHARLPRGYLNHPRLRSAYLLYFMPLQAAKFLHLFGTHGAAIDAALAHGREHGILRVADLGCGPGTASIALLIALSDRVLRGDARGGIPPIELTWYDTNAAIVADGRALLDDLLRRLAAGGFSPEVTLQVRGQPWHRAADAPPPGGWSLALFGNVLNEDVVPDAVPTERDLATWGRMLAHVHGGGALVVEPAMKSVSQYLSRLRDALLTAGDGAPRDKPAKAAGIPLHGPCLHAGPCPLSGGRDWCHFSVPADVPGRLYRAMSARLGSVRSWLKFSWLWMASPSAPSAVPDPASRLVISDPLDRVTGTVLLCEPVRSSRYERVGALRLHRGDIIRIVRAPSDANRSLQGPRGPVNVSAVERNTRARRQSRGSGGAESGASTRGRA
jgi:hypothetical protein